MLHSRRRSRLVSVIFFAMIAAPALVGLFSYGPSGAIAALENRAAAPSPSAPNTISDFNAAPRQIDAFLEDRFGFRETLIAIHHWAIDQLSLGFGESKALIGEDGWLFLTDGGALDMHMGRTPFRAGEASAWLEAATDLRLATGFSGATFAILIAPQKATVYGEYLPDYIEAGRRPSRLDVLMAGAAERGLPFIDVKTPILAEKNEAQLYYRSDTHWTARGAWLAYNALMDQLERDGVAAPRLDPQRVQFPERDFSGDLARMVNAKDRFAELAPGLSIENATPFTETDDDAYTFDAFKTRIITTDATDKPTLLLIGDSYANALIPYLRESFSRIVFTHHQLGAFDRTVLDAYPSDVVVLEMVERMLVHPLAPPETTEAP